MGKRKLELLERGKTLVTKIAELKEKLLIADDTGFPCTTKVTFERGIFHVAINPNGKRIRGIEASFMFSERRVMKNNSIKHCKNRYEFTPAFSCYNNGVFYVGADEVGHTIFCDEKLEVFCYPHNGKIITRGGTLLMGKTVKECYSIYRNQR